uniref:Putative DELAY OF GERMINATION 1-like isoform X1 n=1 Tax=Cymbidium ensifolium TaxID=78740 RepID=A0A5C1YSG6_CYMEN|nr:putative DELAY OF GERMINATION 1-like isoform X1 [Cymbidium ensifolium]
MGSSRRGGAILLSLQPTMSSSPAPLKGRPNTTNNFASFFESWLAEQNRDLHSLLTAAAAPPPRTRDEADARDHHLRPLVSAVLGSYENYYQAKKASARRDVLPMFSPTWTSSTENLLLWAGGWRPTMVFQLLYSKCGIQVESHLEDLIGGDMTWNLADVDAEQVDRIDKLHQATLKREKEISEEEASAQEKVADDKMVQLSHVITEMGGEVGMMEEEMKGKRDAMEEVLRNADSLRIETLKALVEILKPIQAVHFLIAAAELHLRVHEFGRKKDKEKEEAAPAT